MLVLSTPRDFPMAVHWPFGIDPNFPPLYGITTSSMALGLNISSRPPPMTIACLLLSQPTYLPHAKNLIHPNALAFCSARRNLSGMTVITHGSVFIGSTSGMDPTRSDGIIVPQSNGRNSRAIQAPLTDLTFQPS